MKLFLHDDTVINTYEEDGMYRADIDGRHFCAPDEEKLIEVIRFFFSCAKNRDYIVDVEIPEIERLRNTVFGKYTLEEKQEALKALEALTDNPLAINILSYIKSKPTSTRATILTRLLDKEDFSFVTRVEISELVDNVISRAILVEELGNRIGV